MSVDPEQVLEDVATAPAEVEADGLKTKAQPLGDLIKWADRQAAQEAASNRRPGFRITKLVPPGA